MKACCWQSLLSLGLLLLLSSHLMSPHNSTLYANPCTLLLHASMGTAPSPLDYKEHVMRVTNRTIEAQRQSFTWADSSRVNNRSQKSKVEVHPRNVNLAILSYASTDIWDYASYSFAVNALYAARNGYYIVMYDEHTHNYEATDSRWNKVKILERSLDYPPLMDDMDMDYVVWVDADFIFLDFSLRLEQIVAEHPKAHIIMSAEHAGSTTLINSGCIIVRNSQWSRAFLNEWWELADRRLYSDQEQFDLLFERRRREAIGSGAGPSAFLDKVAILPPHRLNSDPPAMSKQRPDHQCLHLMVRPPDAAAAVSWYGRVDCDHRSSLHIHSGPVLSHPMLRESIQAIARRYSAVHCKSCVDAVVAVAVTVPHQACPCHCRSSWGSLSRICLRGRCRNTLKKLSASSRYLRMMGVTRPSSSMDWKVVGNLLMRSITMPMP